MTSRPEVAALLGPDSLVESGLSQEINRLGESVCNLVETLNERYSADKGEDLFKLTNKSAAALNRIRKPVKDYAGYKSFVDDLYFAFWEGPGQRLSNTSPHPFDDVNALRTALQHDVDHGKSKHILTKKRKLGAVFQKYSGEVTPAAMAPERFEVVQANILRALERELKGLAWA